MKRGGVRSTDTSPAMMKAKQSSGSFKPVKPSAPGASKKTPRRAVHQLSPKASLKKNNKKSIFYDDYITKTLLEGSLGQDSRYVM
jgi:hypothetical protein